MKAHSPTTAALRDHERGFALRCDVRLDAGPGGSVEAAFALRAGTLILFGPSGAGKTITLRALAGLSRPGRGRIVQGGVVLVDVESGEFVPPQERGVGFAPQHPALFPHLRVRENILAGAPPGTRLEDAGEMAALVDALALGALLERPPAALSGGERQRVSLARALARRPRLLLLDEPLSALDLVERRRVEAWLRDHLRERAVPAVLVTHDPLEALAMGDHLVLLGAGRTVGEGAPPAMLEAHGLLPLGSLHIAHPR